ncbi:MAG: MerR family transcriptional regulator [bacterium]|nr:MerR family transcriptional regulator [bacterium]
MRPKKNLPLNEEIPQKLYYKIREVSKITGIEPYVLRYWEKEFKQIKPLRTNTNQRLYKKKDLDCIMKIKKLLYEEGHTIAGVQKKLPFMLKSETHRQPELNFENQQRYVEILRVITEELKVLRDLLD